MACYHPLKGYRAKLVNPSGKRSITFNPKEAWLDFKIDLPCGQCIGCRLERSRQWAIRCVHESELHSENCFLTLTYSDENLPADGSLDVTHYQRFMKRLRKKFPEKTIRFFHCGEYGERLGRPHYHACIFGFDFPDKKAEREINGNTLYTSDTLSQLWPNGKAWIGTVTFESAAYVARYITKKVTGPRAEKFYEGKKPEYVTMSRRPGIGKTWYEKFRTDIYPDNFVVIRGKKMTPPKFYATQHEKFDFAAHARIKAKKAVAGKRLAPENTPDRLRVRKTVKLEKIKSLKRKLEV